MHLWAAAIEGHSATKEKTLERDSVVVYADASMRSLADLQGVDRTEKESVTS